MASQWQPPATQTSPEDLNSIPIQQLSLDPSSTATHASESDHTISANSTVEHLASKIASTQTWSHPTRQPDDSPAPKTAATTARDQNRNQQSIATPASPRSPGTAPTYPTALGPDTSVLDHNRIGSANSSRQHQQQQQQQAGVSGGVRSTDAHPTGTPRVIVRIDRDHNIGDEGTRFECEQFPEEMLGRVSIQLMAIDHSIFDSIVDSGTDSCPKFFYFSLRQPVGNKGGIQTISGGHQQLHGGCRGVALELLRYAAGLPISLHSKALLWNSLSKGNPRLLFNLISNDY